MRSPDSVQPEGNASAECESRVLAHVKIGAGMPHLDRALLHAIDDLQGRDDLSGGEDLHAEPAITGVG